MNIMWSVYSKLLKWVFISIKNKQSEGVSPEAHLTVL